MAAHLDATEQAVQTLARSLYRKAAENKPSLFEARDLLGRMLDWSLEDESLRTALFRFVDVLPSLESSAEIGSLARYESAARKTPHCLFWRRRSLPSRRLCFQACPG